MFIILIIMFIINDYYLSFYGRGYNILKAKILHEFNLDFDPLEGHKIEQEEFIQIIGHGTKIDDTLIVNKLKKYGMYDNSIFCEVVDKQNNVSLIKITYNKNGNIGRKVNFQKITDNNFHKTIQWYNLNNSKTDRILNFSHFILKSILILSILVFIFKHLKKV